MDPSRSAHHVRSIAAALIAVTLVMAALALAPQSDAQHAAAMLTTPTPTITPTPGFSLASCQLDLTASTDQIVVGDEVTFDVAIDCACGSGNVPPGSQCDFLLYELNAVDSAGLFAPVSVPVGPPGPRSVTLTAAAVGSGEVTLRWHGELASPSPTGGTVYQWTYRSASIAVVVEPDLPAVPAAQCALDVVADRPLTGEQYVIVAGETVAFAMSPDCVCEPPPNFETTVDCNFIPFELTSVESGGLFEPIDEPIGPPASPVLLTAAQVGSSEVGFTWYGELVSPAPDGGQVLQWATLSASVDVVIEPELPAPTFVILRNGNRSDVSVPHAGETRPPYVVSITDPSQTADIPAGTQASVFVPSGDYVIELVLAPGEELDELTCTESVEIESALLAEELRNMVAVSGRVTDDGVPNDCTFTTTQRVFGDVDCDGRLSILDAAIIAEFTVGLRENASCPTTAGAGQVNQVSADTNDDQVVNVLDAFRVAQCVVGTPNSICRNAGID